MIYIIRDYAGTFDRTDNLTRAMTIAQNRFKYWAGSGLEQYVCISCMVTMDCGKTYETAVRWTPYTV